MTKPPLGSSPHWYVYNKRMQELSAAIQRYLVFIAEHHATIKPKEYYEAISKWSKELECLARLELELEESERK